MERAISRRSPAPTNPSTYAAQVHAEEPTTLASQDFLVPNIAKSTRILHAVVVGLETTHHCRVVSHAKKLATTATQPTGCARSPLLSGTRICIWRLAIRLNVCSQT